jgi:hypothetical protein
MPKIKNIAIFVGIAAAIFLGYYFFIKAPAPEDNLVVSSAANSSPQSGAVATGVPRDFLTLLLSVRNIRLEDAIFSDAAFKNLDGSHSIILTQDGNEGRPNPFAPLGPDTPRNTSGNNQNTRAPQP